MTIQRYKRRHWAVYTGEKELVCLCVYKRGAQNVVRLLEEKREETASALCTEGEKKRGDGRVSRCGYPDPKTGLPCPLKKGTGKGYCSWCEELVREEKERFRRWMKEVNALVEACLGLSPEDLPDCPYADLYGVGMTPEEAADAVQERVLQDW